MCLHLCISLNEDVVNFIKLKFSYIKSFLEWQYINNTKNCFENSQLWYSMSKSTIVLSSDTRYSQYWTE